MGMDPPKRGVGKIVVLYLDRFPTVPLVESHEISTQIGNHLCDELTTTTTYYVVISFLK